MHEEEHRDRPGTEEQPNSLDATWAAAEAHAGNGNGHERRFPSYEWGSLLDDPSSPGEAESDRPDESMYGPDQLAPRSELDEKPHHSSLRPLLVEILQTVLLTLIIFAGVRSVVQNFKVDGASMEPTLHTGQYLLINKVAYTRLEGLPLQLAQNAGLAPRASDGYFPFGGPQYGDIAVFKYPGGPDRDFIKRIIALPGDTVQIDRGRVYVNGVVLDEDYIRAVPTYSLPAQKVPEGNFFVLGDNRPNSSDSHIWGYVPADNMIGKAWVSYWPPNEWGMVVSKEGFATSQ